MSRVCHNLGTLPIQCISTTILEAAVLTPVLAAGGILNRRRLVAALALGADGVWMGTRFVASEADGAGRVQDRIGVAWNTMISNQCPIVLFAFTEQECWAGLSVAEATIDLAKALESSSAVSMGRCGYGIA